MLKYNSFLSLVPLRMINIPFVGFRGPEFLRLRAAWCHIASINSISSCGQLLRERWQARQQTSLPSTVGGSDFKVKNHFG